MDYEQELYDMGVDSQRIADAVYSCTLRELYDTIMWECSESQFPITIEDRRAMGDDMLYPTYDTFGNWENN